jgi:hypothetical protein
VLTEDSIHGYHDDLAYMHDVGFGDFADALGKV